MFFVRLLILNLYPIQNFASLELLLLDFLCIGQRENANYNVLLMMDLFTKCARTAVTKDQTTTTAKVLWSN